MATREIKVPRLAESVSEGVVVAWLKPDGAAVAVDEPVVTLETDKAAVEIPSEFAGVLRHARTLGEKVEVGDVLARVEEGAAAPTKPAGANGGAAAKPPPTSPPTSPPTPAAKPAPAAPEPTLSPSVRKLVEEHGLDPAKIPATGPGGRLLKEDVQKYLESSSEAGGRTATAGADVRSPAPARTTPTTAAVDAASSSPASPLTAMRAPTDWKQGETERAVPMSRIRQRIAERLVKAQLTAAILTTFNEVDMTEVMSLRGRFRDDFEKRHGVKLSYMSFFTRACVLALERMLELNAEIRGTDVVYRRHVHMGIAVGTERGLVVPVVREADRRSFAELEREIARLSAAARDGTVSLEELSGGTFTISNGGVYGSLLSTPILNFPQSGILGMHKIQKRPVVIDDQLVVRPMMYLALSYDHRIVDGEQAVTFLVSVRDRLEDPERMLIEV